jgi:hypothetical protein
MNPETEVLAYPTGKFELPLQYDESLIAQWIDRLEVSPKWYDAAIENLDEAQLATPYRPGGWTVTQVIHHVADSHMNGYIRFKWALTENSPVIKPYQEKDWAVLPDVTVVPVNVSITLLHALHIRWVALLRNLKREDWKRCYIHPDQNRKMELWQALALYAWHTKHHFEHVFRLRERMNWL